MPLQAATWGGDVVSSGCNIHQHIRGDGCAARPSDGLHSWDNWAYWTPWIVASVATEDVALDAGPLLFIGRKAMYSYATMAPPPLGQEPLEWHQRAVLMRCGDIFTRGPR
eukprot:8735137-Alexandrium_andersonii.AAC.1